MVRNHPPVASRAPGAGVRKAWLPARAEKCLPRRPRPPGGRPRRGPRRSPAGNRRAGKAVRTCWCASPWRPRPANQAVNTGRHRQELHVPPQPRHPPASPAAFLVRWAGRGLAVPPRDAAMPARATARSLSGRRSCGALGAKAPGRMVRGQLVGHDGRGRAGTPRSYPGASRRQTASRGAGFRPPAASRRAGAIGSDRLGAPDQGEIGRPRGALRRNAKTAPWSRHSPAAGPHEEPVPARCGELARPAGGEFASCLAA